MRPARSTAVASTITSPAPLMASVMRCWVCQSGSAQPSWALYWHMGATAMRLGTLTGPMARGSNRWALRVNSSGGGNAKLPHREAGRGF